MNRPEYPKECRWLPWAEACPAGWTECTPIAHHAFYGRMICRPVPPDKERAPPA